MRILTRLFRARQPVAPWTAQFYDGEDRAAELSGLLNGLDASHLADIAAVHQSLEEDGRLGQQLEIRREAFGQLRAAGLLGAFERAMNNALNDVAVPVRGASLRGTAALYGNAFDHAMDGAHDLAIALLLQDGLPRERFVALWGPYEAAVPQLAALSGVSGSPAEGDERPPLDRSPFESAMNDVSYLASLLESCDTDELETLVALPRLIKQVQAGMHERLVDDAKSALRIRGQLDLFLGAEASAADMIRQQVGAGFIVFGGRTPREEVASRIADGAIGIAAALLLRDAIDQASFRRIWAPYRFHLPFLMVFEHRWGTEE